MAEGTPEVHTVMALASIAVEQDIFSVSGEIVTRDGLSSSSYRYAYLEQELREVCLQVT